MLPYYETLSCKIQTYSYLCQHALTFRAEKTPRIKVGRMNKILTNYNANAFSCLLLIVVETKF